MNMRAAMAVLVAAVPAAAGLFATPSNSAESCGAPRECTVALTGAGPSPSTLTMDAAGYVAFDNTDSATHTVVFANGLCSVTVTPGEEVGPGVGANGSHPCSKGNFTFYVGRYPYTVDGKFPGRVVTTPLPRSVTLQARSHTTSRGTRLTLHGQIVRDNVGGVGAPTPYPVIVLARHSSKEPFKPIATVRARFQSQANVTYIVTLGWKLYVRPEVTTTYIARVTGQRLCYRAPGCAHPRGQVWANATSRPFTVRIRH